MASAVTQSPPHWVKLELEPVQVNIDQDNSLNFATVQSVVPGAHGLYYRENGERKALIFDNNTGKVLPPTSGWDTQSIFIHLAHGHRHGTHFADYSEANQQFEKNVTAVQKLFASAGLMYNKRPSKVDKPRDRSQSKKAPKSGFEAQPENAHISEESDHAKEGQVQVVVAVEAQPQKVDKTEKKYAELKEKFKAVKAELSEAQKKIKSLEAGTVVEKSPEPVESKKENHDAVLARHAQEQHEKEEEINNLHSVIEDLRERLAKSEVDREEHKTKLDESQDLLKNTKEKVNYLEGQLSNNDVVINVPKGRSRPPSESHDDAISTKNRALETKLTLANNMIRQIEGEKQKLQEANWYANERVGKLEQENGYLKGATDQLKARVEGSQSVQLLEEKDKRIWQLADEKAKLEWRLGEFSQWWSDSKWKVGELESSIAHQRYLLETANGKIQNLNDSNRVSIPPTPPSTGYSVKQSGSGSWQLAPNNSNQNTCSTLPYVLPGFSAFPTLPTFPSIFGFPQQSVETKKVSLTIDQQSDSEIFVTGSFTNWQCALRCEKLPNGKRGVDVDLSRGRYEFRFLVNGQWTASGEFPQVANGFGGQNNVVHID